MGGAVFVYTIRKIKTQTTYNHWFGKNEFDRRELKGQL
jgi:hypothetical protein